jgi:hypothetical protein
MGSVLGSQASKLTPLEHLERTARRTKRRGQGQSEIVEQLSWLNAIDYHTHRLNWVECTRIFATPHTLLNYTHIFSSNGSLYCFLSTIGYGSSF